MSPAFNGSTALQHFKHGNTVEIRMVVTDAANEHVTPVIDPKVDEQLSKIVLLFVHAVRKERRKENRRKLPKKKGEERKAKEEAVKKKADEKARKLTPINTMFCPQLISSCSFFFSFHS